MADAIPANETKRADKANAKREAPAATAVDSFKIPGGAPLESHDAVREDH